MFLQYSFVKKVTLWLIFTTKFSNTNFASNTRLVKVRTGQLKMNSLFSRIHDLNFLSLSSEFYYISFDLLVSKSIICTSWITGSKSKLLLSDESWTIIYTLHLPLPLWLFVTSVWWLWPLQVGFGQTICTPLRPRCAKCTVSQFCPSAFKEMSSPASTSRTLSPKKKHWQGCFLLHDQFFQVLFF